MAMKIIIYTRQPLGQNRTDDLRHVVESHGNLVVAAFSDDPAISGKNKFAGWRALVARLDDADQIVVGSVGDLPGRKVADLLKILAVLRDHGVTLRLNHEAIDTGAGTAATLDLITTYRRAMLSQAIVAGQRKARNAGKILGRPPVPDHIRRRILDALSNGYGTRTTARRFGVSPASVVNIRRMMDVEPEKLAA
jgi:DNA invertase Pin-like site-specific DNA recombinase